MIIDPKPLHTGFDKIDGFIRIYDRTRCLTFFASEKYDAVNHRIRYLISLKSCIAYNFSHCFVKIIVDSYNPLPIEKLLILHNVILSNAPLSLLLLDLFRKIIGSTS